MANKWRDDDFNRYTEEEVRRNREYGSSRYDQPRQFSQDYAGGGQYGSDTRSARERQAQRERLRHAAPDLDPERQYQQESFARPGTFYYGGKPQRQFGLEPDEVFDDEVTADNFSRPATRTPTTYGREYGYGVRSANAQIEENYREAAQFERDMMYDDTPERFHPGREHPEKHRRGLLSRMFGHRGKGPKGYTRSDERIRDDVNDHLTADHYVDATHIDVVVASCECTLNGTVATRDQKRRAEDIAEAIMGVKHVQNNLRIAPTSTTALSTQDRTGTMSTTVGSNPTLSASRSSSNS